MLKGIPHILSPQLLACLQEMGHADQLAIVDANYPGASSSPRLIRLDGHSATDILDAVLRLMPLDQFVDQAAFCYKIADDEGRRPEVIDELGSIVGRHEPKKRLISVERAEFYRIANSSYAMVQSGDRRLYGNVVLKKGVIAPD